MTKYIKKVSTTPVRGNGYIIDSFNTTDPKAVNAPSLRAVMDRYDNNILINSDFRYATIGNDGSGNPKILGWRFSKYDHVIINNTNGITFKDDVTAPARPSLYSFYWVPPLDIIKDYYTVSLAISFDGGAIETKTFTFTKAQALDSDYSLTLKEWEDDGTTYQALLYPNYNGTGSFRITFNITPNKTLSIYWIKLEEGSTATPLNVDYKDNLIGQGLYDMMYQRFIHNLMNITLYPVGSYYIGAANPSPNNTQTFSSAGMSSTTWESKGSVGEATLWKRLT